MSIGEPCNGTLVFEDCSYAMLCLLPGCYFMSPLWYGLALSVALIGYVEHLMKIPFVALI